MQFTIRLKLLLSFGALLLMMVGLSGIALSQMMQMNAKAELVGSNVVPSMNHASDMRRIVNRYRGLQASLLVYDDAENLARVRSELDKQASDLAEIFAVYPNFILDEPERVAFNNFRNEWNNFLQISNNQFIAAHSRGDYATAKTVFSETATNFSRMIEYSISLRNEVHRQADDAVAAVNDSFSTSQTMIIGSSAVLLIVATVLGFWLSNMIARNLGKLAAATNRVAEGDFTQRVELNSNDELGYLAGQFNQMVGQLHTARENELATRAAEDRRIEQERKARDELQLAVNVYSGFISRVASGDLTARVAPQGDVDMQRIGNDLNAMVEALHSVTSQVREANANIAAAAAEILAATTQQAASAAEQSAAITQTTTTIEEVKAIALQTAQQAAQVAQDSQNALTAARQGTLSVEETVTGMGQIRTRVEMIAQTILGLAEQTQAIGAITATVSEISDQSNLLALNAAIEAARAGEQGKSFAVVAQHVRELAERSKAATVQVREILSEIQKATNAAVLVTEEGTKGVESGAKLAGQAGQAIHRIATEVEGGAQANIQMAAAAQQQTAGMEQIGQAMGSIQQATTQALASTRQAERAAQDLHTLAQNLQKTVSTYKL
ncbi:MAG: HAMP domain-containing methyl-accepting chemotaxis protein [Oscillochloridaceae bacterium umkhey_bin13]